MLVVNVLPCLDDLILMVLALAWFFYDFVIYPFSIFAPTIIGALNPENTLIQNIGYGTVVNCFYLPGCLVGGLLMDKIGRYSRPHHYYSLQEF